MDCVTMTPNFDLSYFLSNFNTFFFFALIVTRLPACSIYGLCFKPDYSKTIVG